MFKGLKFVNSSELKEGSVIPRVSRYSRILKIEELPLIDVESQPISDIIKTGDEENPRWSFIIDGQRVSGKTKDDIYLTYTETNDINELVVVFKTYDDIVIGDNIPLDTKGLNYQSYILINKIKK